MSYNRLLSWTSYSRPTATLSLEIHVNSDSAKEFNRVKACRYGTMIYNVNDIFVGRSLEHYGEFSEAEAQMFRRIITTGDVVVEVGANIGAHTVFFAGTVGPTGRVIAIEPQRFAFQNLCANMALNSIVNTKCINAAVGEAAGQIHVPFLDPRRKENFGGLELGNHSQGEVVPVITIDSLKLPRCKLLKVDVEGMEKQVLKGAVETIARLQPVICVENDRPDQSDELTEFIFSLDYEIYPHSPALFNPSNFDGNPQNIFPGLVSYNLFCVHHSIKVF